MVTAQKGLKKWLLIAMGAMLLSTSVSAQPFKAGSYVCNAPGNNGDVQVQIVVDAASIKTIQILKHDETPGLGAVAVDMMAQEIVDAQSLEVDALTGATASSQAVLNATKDCLSQARINP